MIKLYPDSREFLYSFKTKLAIFFCEEISWFCEKKWSSGSLLLPFIIVRECVTSALSIGDFDLFFAGAALASRILPLDQGSNLSPWQWKCKVLTTRLSENSQDFDLKYSLRLKLYIIFGILHKNFDIQKNFWCTNFLIYERISHRISLNFHTLHAVFHTHKKS